jgi:hypothetical protein
MRTLELAFILAAIAGTLFMLQMPFFAVGALGGVSLALLGRTFLLYRQGFKTSNPY